MKFWKNTKNSKNSLEKIIFRKFTDIYIIFESDYKSYIFSRFYINICLIYRFLAEINIIVFFKIFFRRISKLSLLWKSNYLFPQLFSIKLIPYRPSPKVVILWLPLYYVDYITSHRLLFFFSLILASCHSF